MQPIRNRLAMAAVGLALAAPLAAQETPPAEAPETPAAEAPAAEAPAAPADQAPAGPAAEGPAAEEEPAEDAAAPGNPAAPAGDPAKPEVMEIVRDTFGDWQVRCAPEGDECFMYQLALDMKKNPVAEVSILKLPEEAEAAAGVTVVTPLGTLLPTGLGLQVDGGEQRKYPFGYCIQVGCFARFGLAQPSLDALKRGKSGKLTLVSVAQPNAPLTLDLSLSGFTAAYDSLQALPPPPGAAPAPDSAPDAGALEPAPLAPRN
jgi:invasion protein IalB